MRNVIIIFLILVLGIGAWIYFSNPELLKLGESTPTETRQTDKSKPKVIQPKAKPKAATNAMASLDVPAEAEIFVNGEAVNAGKTDVSAGRLLITAWADGRYSHTYLDAEVGKSYKLELNYQIDQGARSWETFQGGPERTGFSAAANRDSLDLAWKTELDDTVKCSPIVKGSTVYLSSATHLLTAVDINNGKVLWREGSMGTAISPIANEGYVFVGSDSGQFGGYRQKNGRLKGEAFLNSYPISLGLISEEAFLVATRENKVFSMATKKSFTGKLPLKANWEIDLAELWKGSATPLLLDDRAVFQSEAEGLVAISLKDGRKLWPQNSGSTSKPVVQMEGTPADGGQIMWSFNDEDHFMTPTPAAQNGIIYTVKDTTLAAVKASDGSQVWEQELDAKATSSVTLGYATLFLGMADGSVRAYSTNKGTPIYSRTVSKKPIFSTPVLFANKLLVGTGEGELLLLSCFSGETVATSKELKGSPIFATPAVTDAGILAINKKGRMVCFR